MTLGTDWDEVGTNWDEGGGATGSPESRVIAGISPQKTNSGFSGDPGIAGIGKPSHVIPDRDREPDWSDLVGSPFDEFPGFQHVFPRGSQIPDGQPDYLLLVEHGPGDEDAAGVVYAVHDGPVLFVRFFIAPLRCA